MVKPGLPKKYAKMGFKKGWKAYKASKGKSSKSKSKPKASNKGGNTRVGNSGFNTQKIFKYLRIGALALPAASKIMQHGVNAGSLNAIAEDYTGFNMVSGTFDYRKLAKGWGPYIAAIAVTYGVPKIGSMIRSFK